MRCQLVDSLKNICQICIAIAMTHGRTYSEENKLGLTCGLRQLRRESDTPSYNVPFEKLAETRFVYWDLSVIQRRDPLTIVVNASDVPSKLGKTGRRYKADVTCTNHANFHFNVPPCLLTLCPVIPCYQFAQATMHHSNPCEKATDAIEFSRLQHDGHWASKVRGGPYLGQPFCRSEYDTGRLITTAGNSPCRRPDMSLFNFTTPSVCTNRSRICAQADGILQVLRHVLGSGN